MASSLYLHIPFCRKKCIYCDFYSTIHCEDTASSYIDVLLEEIRRENSKFHTVYIGGGTPSILGKEQLKKLLESLERCYRAGAEITIEANPESLSEEKFKLLADHGVNRISIGIQSLKDKKLQKLGRAHNSRRGVEMVRLASAGGFKNISVDLIYGVWGEDPEDWAWELEEITKLPITHISCYGLTYEKSTPLFNALKDGGIRPLEDKVVAEMYEYAIERLSVRQFKQYEVSNFAKGDYACRHNLNYWRNDPYVGLGASAVSYLDGVRQENVPDVDLYIKRSRSGGNTVSSSERLTPVKSAKETAAVKIRTKEGIDFAWFKAKTGYDFLELEKKAVKGLIEDGLIKYMKSGDSVMGICLKRKGFLFCDTVSSALL